MKFWQIYSFQRFYFVLKKNCFFFHFDFECRKIVFSNFELFNFFDLSNVNFNKQIENLNLKKWKQQYLNFFFFQINEVFFFRYQQKKIQNENDFIFFCLKNVFRKSFLTSEWKKTKLKKKILCFCVLTFEYSFFTFSNCVVFTSECVFVWFSAFEFFIIQIENWQFSEFLILKICKLNFNFWTKILFF